VDEGFDWVVGSWQTLLSGVPYAAVDDAVLLSNGNVAVTGAYGGGGGADKGFILIVSPAGSVVSGPLYTSIPKQGMGGAQITVTGSGEIAAVYGSTDYAGCSAGCPATLVRATQSPLQAVATVTIPYPFSVHAIPGFGWSTAGYITFATEQSTLNTHVSWLGSTAASVSRDIGVGLQGTGWGDLVVGTSAIAWASTHGANPATTVRFGLYALDGTQLLSSTLASSSNNPSVHTGSLAWFGSDLALGWSEYPSSQQLSRVARYSTSGTVVAGPTNVGATGRDLFGIAVLGPNLLVNTRVLPSVNTAIYRLRSDLQPVTSPSGPLVVGITNAYSPVMIPTSAGLLLVRGVYSGGTVLSALVHCPP
jgi:hypothetical protein